MKSLILVVDDNEDLLFQIQLLLENHNFNVVTANGGAKALSLLKESEKIPDLILCDLIMPNINGYEFFEIISKEERFHKIPFIFLTALSFDEDFKNHNIINAENHITKPFKIGKLIEMVKKKLNF